MNVNTSSLKIIVKTFELIVQINIMMKNQKYIHFIKLHKMMLTTEKNYQNIIRCDMKFEIILSKKTKKTFIKNFIDDDFVKNFHKSKIVTTTAKNFYNENFENNNFITNILIVAANSDIDENLNFSIISFKFRLLLSKKTKNRKFKINKFDNFFDFLMFMSIYICRTIFTNTKQL